MINPQELRIGNWFKWNILASMGSGIDQIRTATEIERYNDFKEPIPITKEILLKCGFEVIEDGGPKGLCDECKISTLTFLLWYPNELSIYVGLGVVNMHFLHELQNFYYAVKKTELNFVQ